MAATRGSQLDGKYKLVRLLGVGDFGAVFLAEEQVAGHVMRRVALKVIRADRSRLTTASSVYSPANVVQSFAEIATCQRFTTASTAR